MTKSFKNKIKKENRVEKTKNPAPITIKQGETYNPTPKKRNPLIFYETDELKEFVESTILEYFQQYNNNFDNKQKQKKLNTKLLKTIPNYLDQAFLGDFRYLDDCIKCKKNKPVIGMIVCKRDVEKKRKKLRENNEKMDQKNKLEREKYIRKLEEEEERTLINKFCQSTPKIKLITNQ
ncbi:hypothetical protein ACTFIZ_003831 [Dictyostelium cf. discoideum]